MRQIPGHLLYFVLSWGYYCDILVILPLHLSSPPSRFRPPTSHGAQAGGPRGPGSEGCERRLLQSPQPRGLRQGQGNRNRNRRQIQPGGTDHPCVRLRDLILHPLHTVQGQLLQTQYTALWYCKDSQTCWILNLSISWYRLKSVCCSKQCKGLETWFWMV